MSGLEVATKKDKIEEERNERMEKLTHRQKNLENDMKSTYKALDTFEKSRETSDNVNAFNDAIEILREHKDDIFSKFLEILENLETAMDDPKQIALAKTGVDSLKSIAAKIEAHLKIVEEKGAELVDPEKLRNMRQSISLVKEWIGFFSGKTTDAEKQESMVSQYETMNENLGFMKELGEDPAEIATMEEMVQLFKGQTEKMKPVAVWKEEHVENLKKAINNLVDDIDEIDLVNSNLNEAIQQLADGATSQLSLE